MRWKQLRDICLQAQAETPSAFEHLRNPDTPMHVTDAVLI